MPNLQISWLLLVVGLQTVASLGQSPPGPRFEADGVLSYSNGNHVAPLAPGVLMLIRGSGLGPQECCPSVSLGSGQREEPSPLLPNPDMANLVIYPTELCRVQVTVGRTKAGLMSVQDQQIIFKVPREMPIEGTAELRVTYLGESKAVTLPLGGAALSLDGVARVGMPVWVKVSLYDRVLSYPFDSIPANFRCNKIEVRKNGKLLPRVPTAASQQVTSGSGSSLGECGEAGYPGEAPGIAIGFRSIFSIGSTHPEPMKSDFNSTKAGTERYRRLGRPSRSSPERLRIAPDGSRS